MDIIKYDQTAIRARAIDYSSQGIVISDLTQPDNPIVDVNAAFTAMTGYAKADIIGKNCRFLQGSETNQPARELLRRAITDHRDIKVTLRNYRKDGSMFWNELAVSIIFDVNEQAIYCIGVQQDVTSQHLLMEELSNKNNELDKINAMMVGRELKMVELKKELASLK